MRVLTKSQAGLMIAGLAWSLIIGVGFAELQRYAAAPGRTGSPPPRWPTGGRIRPDPGRANLIILAHPRCPCTRASVDELARIMTGCQGSVTAHVLFFRPCGTPGSWASTDLWRGAASIPGVRVHADEDGAEADRFGAATSGHALLYDPTGRLLYSGGITAARGHAGDNAGSRAVVALLTGGGMHRSGAPVFGCPIHGDRRAGEGP